jgi:hypothetical protein
LQSQARTDVFMAPGRHCPTTGMTLVRSMVCLIPSYYYPSNFGYLRTNVEPDNAEVWVDDKYF